MHKAIAERLGTWRYGEEYPYSRAELAQICERAEVSEYEFFGDSLWDSFRFLNPFGSIRKALRLPPRREIGSPLDAYFSYALVLYAVKDEA